MPTSRTAHPLNPLAATELTETEQAAELPPSIPDVVLPPVDPRKFACFARIYGPVPDDVRDPQAMRRRVEALSHVACATGAAVIELLLRVGEERRLGTHLRDGSATMAACSASISLHQAIIRFQHEGQRRDGLDIARAAVESEHGAGVADLVMLFLARLRDDLLAEMRAIAATQSQICPELPPNVRIRKPS
jgi:hypothetical protein